MNKSVRPQFVDLFVARVARDLSHARKLEVITGNRDALDTIPSSTQAMLEDYLNARAFFSLQVLEREIPFVLLNSESYQHLEGSWLRRVKQTRAFYIWKSGSTGSEEGDFDEAGKKLRSWLLERKPSDLGDFEAARAYIEERYLGTNGRLDDKKPYTHQTIADKARRIWQTTGETDARLNWFRAKLYVTMFYENIIGAVKSQEERAIKTAFILKAFEFSKAPESHYLIINAFEAVLAIEFLDKGIIEKLLKDPKSFDFNMVPVSDWPENLGSPTTYGERFRYERDAKQIVYEGEMTEKERDALKAEVNTEEQRVALDHLFLQSRRRPLEQMVL